MKQKQNKNERITQIGTQTTGTQTETQLLGTQIIKQTRTWHKLRKKKNIPDRIEPVSRVEALIPDDVIHTRSGLLDTSQKVWMTPLPDREDKSR